MLFNSFTFIIFFAVVLLLHNLPFSWRVKKFNLLWASYFFSGAWNPPFVLVLVASTVLDWFAANGIHRAHTQAGRRAWLLASLTGNLGMLGFFKYGNFFLENFRALVGAIGIEYVQPQWNIVLPIGISFYTFQTLSYTIDVYRRKAAPALSLLDYALFVTFFPQLVAGPILRVDQFLPQCAEPRRATAQQMGWGLCLLCLGLFEKVVLADGVFAPVVNAVYGASDDPSVFSAWAATLAFGGQIFCDFAGYSTCAVGVGLCLGFVMPENFRFPCASVGFVDFWSRWHISLSTWMRDYVFFSFRGSRRNTPRAAVNLLLTMMLIGLWHGAAWTFVIWGVLHGIFLIVERVLRRYSSGQPLWDRPWMQFSLAALTAALAAVTGVFFRAGYFDRAVVMLRGLAGLADRASAFSVNSIDATLACVAGVGIFLTHWCFRKTALESIVDRCPWWLLSVGIAMMLFLMATLAGEDRAFIYFQF